MCLEPLKSTEFVLARKRVLVGFVCVRYLPKVKNASFDAAESSILFCACAV